MKKYVSYVIKGAITGGLILFFLRSIDISASIEALTHTNGAYFFFSLLVVFIGWIFTALRWKLLLQMMDVHVRVQKLFLYNLVGNFYGIVLPGGKVSGDIMCAYRFTKEEQRERGGVPIGSINKKYFFSVIGDRLLALVSMVMMLAVYFIVSHPAVRIFEGYQTGIGIVVIAGALLGLSAFFVPIFDSFIKLFERVPIKRMQALVESLLAALRMVRNHRKELIIAMAFSIISIFLNMWSWYLLGKAIGISLSFLLIGFGYIAATLLVSLPITLGGIGLREGGFVYIATSLGANSVQSVAVSLLALIVFALYAVVGGLIEAYWVFRKPTYKL